MLNKYYSILKPVYAIQITTDTTENDIYNFIHDLEVNQIAPAPLLENQITIVANNIGRMFIVEPPKRNKVIIVEFDYLVYDTSLKRLEGVSNKKFVESYIDSSLIPDELRNSHNCKIK